MDDCHGDTRFNHAGHCWEVQIPMRLFNHSSGIISTGGINVCQTPHKKQRHWTDGCGNMFLNYLYVAVGYKV